MNGWERTTFEYNQKKKNIVIANLSISPTQWNQNKTRPEAKRKLMLKKMKWNNDVNSERWNRRAGTRNISKYLPVENLSFNHFKRSKIEINYSCHLIRPSRQFVVEHVSGSNLHFHLRRKRTKKQHSSNFIKCAR